MASPQVDQGPNGREKQSSERLQNATSLVDRLKMAPPSLTKGLLDLLDRLHHLEEENQGLRLDIQDQTVGRKQWQERARKTELRQASNPYLIALIDGNGLCFRNRLVQAGKVGAEEAAKVLTREIREHAHEHHKNDLPRTIAVVVQIFLSIDKISQDLVAAEAIKDTQELHIFFRSLASQPGVYVNDCRADAVQSLLKETYELHLENCHCQHAILALGPSSNYYATLAEYGDDEYTQLKTSLIRPGGGFPEDDLPFHIIQLSVMHDVPLIPLVGDAISELYPTPAPRVRRALDRPPPKPESFTSAIVNHSSQSVPTAQGSDVAKSLDSASLGSNPSSQNARHALSPPLNMPPPGGPIPDLHSPGPQSPDPFQSNYKTSSQTGSAGASSQSSARSRHDATDSPSRQQDWEIANQLSKLPDTLPTNRLDVEREMVRKRQSTAVQAVRHSNQLPKQSIAHRPYPTKPGTTGVRYRPARHSPERGPPPVNGRGLPNVSRTPARDAMQFLPEIPVRNDIFRNQDGQRIDSPLPNPSGANFAAFNARTRGLGVKLCNEHHLKDACPYKKGAETGLRPPNACVYDHGSIDNTVLLVLMQYSRTKACRAGSQCDDFTCILGHHCTPDLHRLGQHGHHRRCPWAGIAHEGTEPDPAQTIYYQPADAAAKSAALEREREREREHLEKQDENLLYDPDVW